MSHDSGERTVQIDEDILLLLNTSQKIPQET